MSLFNFKKAFDLVTLFPENADSLPIATFDFEATGLHLHHDAFPFMLCVTFSDKTSLLWEAEVDPFTRMPQWSESDKAEIRAHFERRDIIHVASNSKFDVGCIKKLLPDFDVVDLLKRCHDTIQQHHAVKNNEPHDLKGAAVKHAKMLDTDETALLEAGNKARVRAKVLGFKIASAEHFPYIHKRPKKGWGVMDMWVPRAVAKWEWEHSAAYNFLAETRQLATQLSPEAIIRAERRHGWDWRPPELGGKHPWWTLAATYCGLDTVRSLLLFNIFKNSLVADNLWDQYMENRTTLVTSFVTEQAGLSINLAEVDRMLKVFKDTAAEAQLQIQASLNLIGFKTTSPASIKSILYDYFHLPVTHKTKNGNPATNAEFLAYTINNFRQALQQEGIPPEDYAPPNWQKDVEPYKDYKRRLDSWYKLLIAEERPSVYQLLGFATSLLKHKKAQTAISYLENYKRSALPVSAGNFAHVFMTDSELAEKYDEQLKEYGLLFTSLNPVGTKSTRFSGSNPNPQNISKGGKGKKGLEWLSTRQFSLRSVFGPIPGREWLCFDYKQLQLVIFAIVSGDPKMIEAVIRGDDFHMFMAREIFDLSPEEKPSEWQRDIAKTVNFAFVFGAREDKLNRTAGMPGLYAILQTVFPVAVGFLEKTEWEVRRRGYVTTPGGYRLYVPEGKEYSGVNYKVQGSEGEIVKRAQYGIHAYCEKRVADPSDFRMNMYVHDEVVFDGKIGHTHHHIGPIAKIMNDAAMTFGIPAKVDAKLCRKNWSEGEKIILA